MKCRALRELILQALQAIMFHVPEPNKDITEIQTELLEAFYVRFAAQPAFIAYFQKQWYDRHILKSKSGLHA